MIVLSVEGIEEILRKGIEDNIDLINSCISEISYDKYDKWQKVNDLYYSLEGVDNPIVRAMLALRVIGYAYEASDIMERMLVKKCSSVSERKRIYGARMHAVEKKEAIMATIASVAEDAMHEFVNNKYQDSKSQIANKLYYLQEFKKLADSSISLKDIKLESSNVAEEEKRRKEDILTIMEQYKRIEIGNDG